MQSASRPAILYGPPLDQEHHGPLTLPAYLRAVTELYASREALVFRGDGRIIRWTYADLKERAMEVARALLALDCGKDSRIGILMTRSLRYPHLRYLALIGDVPAGSAFSSWPEFLNRAESSPPRNLRATNCRASWRCANSLKQPRLHEPRRP